MFSFRLSSCRGYYCKLVRVIDKRISETVIVQLRRNANLYLHHISQTAMDGRNIPGFYYGKRIPYKYIIGS